MKKIIALPCLALASVFALASCSSLGTEISSADFQKKAASIPEATPTEIVCSGYAEVNDQKTEFDWTVTLANKSSEQSQAIIDLIEQFKMEDMYEMALEFIKVDSKYAKFYQSGDKLGIQTRYELVVNDTLVAKNNLKVQWCEQGYLAYVKGETYVNMTKEINCEYKVSLSYKF